MIRAIEMGWFILDKYYNMTDQVPVYAAALLLDPRRRAAYIKKNWPEEWYEPALTAAGTFWKENFNISALENPPSTPVSMGPPLRKKELNEFALLMQEMDVVTADTQDIDDFRVFAELPATRIDCTSPLEWWCRFEQRQRYPKLSRMAIAILSIPAESSEPERVFSGARRTLSWDRGSLTPRNVERVECIANWLKEGLIRPLKDHGLGFPMEANAEDDEDDDDFEDIAAGQWI